MLHLDPTVLLGVSFAMVEHLMASVVALLALVAIADYAFQYRQWYERLKMSLQEVKDRLAA